MRVGARTGAIAALAAASLLVVGAAVAVASIGLGPCHDSPPAQRMAMWGFLAAAFVLWVAGLVLAANDEGRSLKLLASFAVADALGAVAVVAFYSHQMTTYFNCG
jgi:hypothetical protein